MKYLGVTLDPQLPFELQIMKLPRPVLSKALFASAKRFMTITTLLVGAYFHLDYRSPV